MATTLSPPAVALPTLAPTIDSSWTRVKGDAEKERNSHAERPPERQSPLTLSPTSGSGLDPDISPAAAEFQIPRIARARHVSEG